MAENTLFKRLEKIFSTDVVIRNKGGDQLKVIDINTIQRVGKTTNQYIDRYNRIYSRNTTSLYGQQLNLNYKYIRPRLYSEYDLMDTDAIISSALDIIAEECTLKNETGDVLRINTSNDDIKKVLYNLHYDILNIEFNLWSWIRQMCKFGDFFLKLHISDQYGVYNVTPYSAYYIERIETSEDKEGNPHLEVKFVYHPEGVLAPQDTMYYNVESTENRPTWENFEVAHFRLTTDINYAPYGRCLVPNTRIYTENGIEEIKNIKKDDKVWTYNIEKNQYELSTVLNTINSGIKNIYSVKTRHNEIKGSDNHPILVWDFNENKPNYKQIKELTTDDLICVSKEIDIKYKNPKLNKSLPEIGPHDWKTNMDSQENFPEYITSEFARFWGFMLGDGWKCQQNYQIGFARGIDDELNLYYENLLKKYSGKQKLNEINSKTSKVNPSGVVVCSKVFYHLMEINGYDGKSYSKRLPSWIYKCNKETQLSLIKGLIDADGYISTDKWGVNSYNITLNNYELLTDIKILLDRLKIKTGTIRPRKWNGKCNILGIEYNCKQAYDFTFYLDGKYKKQNKDNDKINDKYNVDLYKILSITEELPEETYDIQVDKNSNFIANGIIVHNSFIEPARKLYKQYTMMEEAMLIHRIVRSADKRIFYINVGSIPPNEVETFMQKIVNNMKRSPHIDPQTGEYNLRYNLQNLMEDYYIPVRGGDTTTKIDNVPGLNYTGIEDVEYLREKLFAALKIPKAFLGFEKDLEGKSTLAAQDIRFARTIDRIQRIVLSELYKISLIHLYAQGFRDEDLTNFELNLTSPSIIFEQEKIALLKDKVDLAVSILDNKLLPSEYVYSNIFNLSEKEYEEYRDLTLEDAKRKFRIDQIENEGNDPYITGKSYGTPHDLATSYGKGRMDSNPSNLPDGYDGDIKLGRPQEKITRRNTQQDPLGKDRLGVDGMKHDDNESDSIRPQYKGGSPLALENYIRDKENSIKKTLLTEDKKNISFLDEKNLSND